MAVPGFWDNPEAAQAVVAKLKAAKSIVTPIVDLLARIEDARTLYELAVDADSADDLAEADEEAAQLAGDLERLELRTLLAGEHDAGNCYLSVHAGAGGTESCDWAEMLLRMYVRYFERVGLAAELVDRVDGEEAGVRSATIHVKGAYAFGYLSCERGVHRLVRISPYDSQSRRHTSFAAIDVLPELKEVDVEIDWDKDVREDVFRSSGPGGQNVNKLESAIRLTHLSTNIVVQCQNERSQHKNRAEARKMLAARLYQHEQAKRDAELSKMYDQKGQIAFGSQIRSYVLYPYQLVRDERTDLKVSQTEKILDGDLQEFIDAYLRHRLTQG